MRYSALVGGETRIGVEVPGDQRHWDGKAYVEQGSILQLKDRALFRNVVWNTDGKMFVVTRYDEPSCQVFQYDGRNYDRARGVRGEMAKEKIVAAGFSLNGQLLATATFSETLDKRATVQLRNVATLAPVPKKANGFKAQFPVPIEVKPTQLCFGPGEDELTIVAWGSRIHRRQTEKRDVSAGVLRLIGCSRHRDAIGFRSA